FLSVDPLTKKYPFYTPFQFAGNCPILAIDIDGLEGSQNKNKTEEVEKEKRIKENKERHIFGTTMSNNELALDWANKVHWGGYIKEDKLHYYEAISFNVEYDNNGIAIVTPNLQERTIEINNENFGNFGAWGTFTREVGGKKSNYYELYSNYVFEKALYTVGYSSEKLKSELQALAWIEIGGQFFNAFKGFKIGKNKGKNEIPISEFKYDPKVRLRAVAQPDGHLFPYSFDKIIVENGIMEKKKGGYLMFKYLGESNGKIGFYEIGATEKGVVDHRLFRPFKGQ
ncbi:MAG: hypothetical protein K2P88_06215, partial [Chitinophagaceae bacterium]|nr:hypothetical protein [Chitinophagaceae bacterium]